jgi:hypothetical protein
LRTIAPESSSDSPGRFFGLPAYREIDALGVGEMIRRLFLMCEIDDSEQIASRIE